jgi:hypothetical protein
MKIITWIKDLPRQWKAETPKVAKWIRNVAGTLTVVLPTAWGVLSATGIGMPDWFNHSIGYIILGSAVIAGVAGTKEKKKDETA